MADSALPPPPLTPPSKLFSFTDWAITNPATPPPGDRLDAQFNEITRAIQILIDRLKCLTRDDGQLSNYSVGLNSLDQGLAALIVQPAPPPPDIHKAINDAFAARDAAQASREAIEAMLRKVANWVQSAMSVNAEARAALDAAEHARNSATAIANQFPAAQASLNSLLSSDVRTLTSTEQAEQLAWLWAAKLDGPVLTEAEYAAIDPALKPPGYFYNPVGGVNGMWSAEWWSLRSANAFGMLAWWYQGAWPSPGPPSTPNTPTGQPLPPGSMYFNTTLGVMMVWNGSTWVNAAAPQKGVTASLYYTATAGQTVFPLATIDKHGKNFTFNQTAPEGTEAYVNGVRLEPTFDFTVDTVASTVTFLRPLTVNANVGFNLLTPASQLTPSGTVNTVMLNPIVPDGVKTAFTGLTVAMNGHAVNTTKNEELQVSLNGIVQQPGAAYSATGASITFTTAPEADANVFIIWFGPTNP